MGDIADFGTLLMNFDPVLPEPLEATIAGWNLPQLVELKFYEFLDAKLKAFPFEVDRTIGKTYEFCIPDPISNETYIMYGRVVGRGELHEDGSQHLVLVNLDFDCIMQPQHD